MLTNYTNTFLNYKKLLCVITLFLIAIVAYAEPSGRGVDYGDYASTLKEDIYTLVTSICFLFLGGILYLLKEKLSFLKIIASISFVIGGLGLFVSGWSLVSKFILFPIIYVVIYLLRSLIYIGVMLIPFFIGYYISRFIKIKWLKYLILIIIVVFLAVIEYHVVVELGASEFFPKWNFTAEFYQNLYPEDY